MPEQVSEMLACYVSILAFNCIDVKQMNVRGNSTVLVSLSNHTSQAEVVQYATKLEVVQYATKLFLGNISSP
jgi:hypothetical protein